MGNRLTAKMSVDIHAPATKVWEALIRPDLIKQLKSTKVKQKICSRGHTYQGSGPCPICWPGRAGEKSEPKVPTDLRKALTAAPSVAALWWNLTPIARRDFIFWIDSAKQPETRKRRIDSLGGRLAAGKRRP
jgi:Bacteriocin-protection, YdeI or OmpD-Associated